MIHTTQATEAPLSRNERLRSIALTIAAEMTESSSTAVVLQAADNLLGWLADDSEDDTYEPTNLDDAGDYARGYMAGRQAPHERDRADALSHVLDTYTLLRGLGELGRMMMGRPSAKASITYDTILWHLDRAVRDLTGTADRYARARIDWEESTSLEWSEGAPPPVEP